MYVLASPFLAIKEQTMIKNILALLLTMSGLALFAQPPSSEAEYEKKYQQRIKKDVLYGVYIPEDLADAFSQLNKLIDVESKKKFKLVGEEEASRKLHFSLGRWIDHNWGFYGGSRFSHYLKSLKLYDPDSMSKFVIITYHRYLNGKPLEVKKLLETFALETEKKVVEKRSKGKVIFEKTRILDPSEVPAVKNENH